MASSPGGESVYVRNGELAYKRVARIFNEIAFHLIAGEGIGTVEHHELLALFGAGFHSHTHRRDECERAAAYILYVVDEYIHILEHLGGGLTVLP